jgi:hypothetical protein
MPHHEERPPSALAHGPAKQDDIERARRQVATAEAQDATALGVEQAMGEMEAACQTIRDDLSALKRAFASGPRDP